MHLILALVWSIMLVSAVFAQDFGIDSPLSGSIQSGTVAPPNGWKCERNGEITARIDGGAQIQFSEDLPRGDTASVCGNSGNNGFATQPWNWNVSEAGNHTIEFFDAGEKFAEVNFSVVTFGTEFLLGPSASFIVKDFPDLGKDVEVSWDAAIQNFRITADLSPGTAPLRATPLLGTWVFNWEIVNTFTDTYVLDGLTTQTDPELAVGTNQFGNRVTAGAVQAISPGNPLPYDFAVLSEGPILCELHVVYWLEPQYVVGKHYSLVTELDGSCGSSLGDPHDVQGVRSSPVLAGQAAPQLEQMIEEIQLQEIQSQGSHKTAPLGVARLIADLQALQR